MTSFSSWIAMYLEINGLLAVMWLILWLSRRCLVRASSPVSSLAELRTVRWILLATVLVPPLARLIPVPISAEVSQSAFVVQQWVTDAGAAGATVASNVAPAVSRISIEPETALLYSGLCVFSILLIRLLVRVARLHGIVRRSHRWKKLGRITVLVSDELSVPFATRLFGSNQIVIPQLLLLSPGNLAVAVSHEGQHLRNGDANWEIVMELACLLCFWNPFAYAWKHHNSQLQELACDEVVLQKARYSRQQYGRCLLFIARQMQQSRLSPVASSCMGKTSVLRRHLRSALEDRVRRIMNQNLSASTGSGGILYRLFMLATVTATGTVLVACSTGLPISPNLPADEQRNVRIGTAIYSIALNSDYPDGIDLQLLNQLPDGTGPMAEPGAPGSSLTDLTEVESFIRNLQQFGAVSHVLSPEMMTLSGRSARIISEIEVPYHTQTPEGASRTSFLPMGIRLEVLPTIRGNEQLLLDLTLSYTSSENSLPDAPVTPDTLNTTTIESKQEARIGDILVLTSQGSSQQGTNTQLVMLVRTSVY